MMSLLRSALDRYLEANPPQSERGSASGTGGAVRAVGYSFALNAMGMCILHLPPEAVELEAQRIQNHVVSHSWMNVC
jgi:hypothetical protein